MRLLLRVTFGPAILAWGMLLLCPAALLANGDASADEQFHQVIEPLLEQYCYHCHGYGGGEGGLALDELHGIEDRQRRHDKWHAVWKNLRAQIMPPAEEEQPSEVQRTQILRWIERAVFHVDPHQPDPGRVTIRRLNREEYRFSVLDLLGVEFDVAEEFPPDDTGYGFDTIGDVLSMSPLLLEKYFKAAQTVVDQTVVVPPAGTGEVDDMKKYLRVFPYGRPPAGADERTQYAREILGRFAEKAFRRPVDEQTLDRLVSLAMGADDQHQVQFEQGIAHALTAILVSPRFLFRAEAQPHPNDPAAIVPLDEYALASRLSYFLCSSLPDDELLELASQNKLRENLDQQVDRLLDDDRLRRFVRNFVGQWLHTRDVEGVYINAERILKHRSNEDPEQDFDHRVRRAMRKETEMFFEYLLRENRSAVELLTADYTFLNEPLAEFYEIEGVEGRRMRRVELPAGSHRGGILSHGSILVTTSNPTRTSPVKRGLFVLENILGTPAPPPPPDVPELEESARGVNRHATMRQLMQKHREAPMCASCHARMDPLGLALENYNALGLWRDEEAGQPIDPSGKLITGESFADAQELAQIVANQRRTDFYRCLTEKMLTFALGRGIEYYDMPTVDQIATQLDEDQGKMRTLIHAIVASPPFQMRRGDGDHVPAGT